MTKIAKSKCHVVKNVQHELLPQQLTSLNKLTSNGKDYDVQELNAPAKGWALNEMSQVGQELGVSLADGDVVVFVSPIAGVIAAMFAQLAYSDNLYDGYVYLFVKTNREATQQDGKITHLVEGNWQLVRLTEKAEFIDVMDELDEDEDEDES